MLAVLSGCGAPAAVPSDRVNDPFEAENREIFAGNLATDTAILRPASRAWGAVVPQPVRRSAMNFARNLDTPGHVVNDILQGEVDDAAHNFFRFAINTTLGIGGLFDPATSMGLEARTTDFGQTLMTWGADEGVFVVMPFFGPRTERHAYGTLVDFVLNPSRALLPVDSPSIASAVIQTVDTRYTLRSTIDEVLYQSADGYALSRSIYLQNRRFFLAGGETADYIDPYDDLFGE